MRDLEGKAAFVTGAASGIGLALSQALLEVGMRVVGVDVDDAALKRALGQLGVDHGEFLPLHLDVTDRNAWQDAAQKAEQTFGPVAVLCNNAGIGPDGYTLADMSPEHWDRMIGISLTGIFNGVRTFASRMKAQKEGHIVNTSSMSGFLASATLGSYTAAKYGVVGLSEVLKVELAPHGVGVSVLCPGMARSNLFNNARAQFERDHGKEKADAFEKLMASSMETVWVARRVVRAIHDNELYIFTHPEFKSSVEARFASVLASFGESAQPGYTESDDVLHDLMGHTPHDHT